MTNEQIAVEPFETLNPELAELLNPRITALVVVDVQKGYFSAKDSPLCELTGANTTGLEQTAERIKGFIDKSRKYSIAATVFTRMEENPAVMPDNFAAKMKRDHTPALTKKGEPSYDYYLVQPDPEKGDKVIEKTIYSAFENTDLDGHLKREGVQTIIIVGGFGSVCVDATAVSAAHKGYHVFIPRDLVANLDASENAGGVDELPAFLQRFQNVYGESIKSSQSILNTCEKTQKKD